MFDFLLPRYILLKTDEQDPLQALSRAGATPVADETPQTGRRTGRPVGQVGHLLGVPAVSQARQTLTQNRHAPVPHLQ